MLLQTKGILLVDYFKGKFTIFSGQKVLFKGKNNPLNISTKALKKLAVYTLTTYLFDVLKNIFMAMAILKLYYFMI